MKLSYVTLGFFALILCTLSFVQGADASTLTSLDCHHVSFAGVVSEISVKRNAENYLEGTVNYLRTTITMDARESEVAMNRAVMFDGYHDGLINFDLVFVTPLDRDQQTQTVYAHVMRQMPFAIGGLLPAGQYLGFLRCEVEMAE